jgi:hypothetical protein
MQRRGSMVVRDRMGNMEIIAAHQGGIVHEGRVVIEKADMFDLFAAMREYLIERMCLECVSSVTMCQCSNDE